MYHHVLHLITVVSILTSCSPLYYHILHYIIISSVLSSYPLLYRHILHSINIISFFVISSILTSCPLFYHQASILSCCLHSIILPPFYDVASTPRFKLKHSKSVSTFPWSTPHNLYPGEKQWGPGDLWVLFSGKNGE